MKKRYLLIVLATLIFTCIFTLSVSAADTNAFGTVESIEKIDLTDMNTDGEARVVLVESDGVTYHTYPSNYIVKNSATLAFDFSKIGTDKSGTAYNKDSIVRFELPAGVTTISDSVAIGSKAGLVEVVLGNDLEIIAKEVFNGYKALSKVTLGSNVKEIGRYAFNGTAITEIVIPNSVTTLGNNAFQNCTSLVNVTLSEKLTEIQSGTFYGCSKLVITIPDSVITIADQAFQEAFAESGSITINKTSNLKSIGSSTFRKTSNLKSIYLPSTLETIGSYAFDESGCKSYENLENTKVTVLESNSFYTNAYTELRLPKNLTEIKSNAIFFVNKVYVPKTLTTVAASAFSTPWNSGMVIFTGSSANLLKTCTKLADATVIQASQYDTTKTYTGIHIVVGYNHCDAFNKGVHNIDLNNANIVYSNGYDDDGVYSVSCTDCDLAETENVNPIFVCLGTSAPETGKAGIALGFTVDRDALERFLSIPGKSLEFGVFAALSDNLGTNSALDSDGNAASGVVKADLTQYEIKSFDLKIVGFETETQKSKDIAMGAYVIVSDGETKNISYIQDKTLDMVGNYYVVSYNDVNKNEAPAEQA